MTTGNVDQDLGSAIRTMRAHRAMSQDDLATAVTKRGYPMSQATVGKIERGDRKVTVGEGDAIAGALRTTLQELVLGPSYVTREVLAERLRALRAELVEAAKAFDSGRALVAIEAVGLSEYDQDWLRPSVLEPIEEVISDYQKDMRVESEGRDRRDELDGTLPGDIRRVGGLYGEYQERFGGTVPPTIHPRAASVIARRSPGDDG